MARLHAQAPGWRERYWHLVFLPTYKEPVNIIDATLRQIAKSTYPCDRIMIVLAGEERDREKFEANAELMKKKYGNVFGHFFVTVHPTGLPDEIPGKGSNLNYSGRRIQAELDRLGIHYENVIASSLDVDTVVHPQYFAHLTHSYATVEHPMRASYQPVVVFNNILGVARAGAHLGVRTTFWLLGELARPNVFGRSHRTPCRSRCSLTLAFGKRYGLRRTRVFSSRESGATPATTAWSRCTSRFHGCRGGRVVLGSLKALYKQQRRWAWGVEHFPYIVEHICAIDASRFGRRALLWNPHGGHVHLGHGADSYL